MEKVEVINERLREHFGQFEDGQPNWRIVWSDDMTEKRLCDYDDNGTPLLTPEIREVPKYTYAQHRYILERLIPVPASLMHELTTKVSYEPVWTFQNAAGDALPPNWEAAKFLIDKVLNNIADAQKGFAKYRQSTDEALEQKEKTINHIYTELFGNESPVTDALALDRAVGYGTRQRKDWLH